MKINFYKIFPLACIYSCFFIVLSVLFFSNSSAENYMQIKKCETEMLKAFTSADVIRNQEFKKYLEIPEVTAVAKSQNIASYDRTYQCYNSSICFALRNPNPKLNLLKNMGECNNLKTVGDLQKELKADFSQCNFQFIESAKLLYSRCERFAEKKNIRGRNYFAKKFIQETHLQNQSFLGAKIFDIRKRMAVLLKKTRQFSTHFIKVRDDLQCTIGDSSGYQN